MSQRAVERALGKLVTDEQFRRRFFADPARAVLHAGLDLTTDELDALTRLPAAALAALEHHVDDRIRRLAVDAAMLRRAPR